MITNPTAVTVVVHGPVTKFKLYADRLSAAVVNVDVPAPTPVGETYTVSLAPLLAAIPEVQHGVTLSCWVAVINATGLSAPMRANQDFQIGPSVPVPPFIVELIP